MKTKRAWDKNYHKMKKNKYQRNNMTKKSSQIWQIIKEVCKIKKVIRRKQLHHKMMFNKKKEFSNKEQRVARVEQMNLISNQIAIKHYHT